MIDGFDGEREALIEVRLKLLNQVWYRLARVEMQHTDSHIQIQQPDDLLREAENGAKQNGCPFTIHPIVI